MTTGNSTETRGFGALIPCSDVRPVILVYRERGMMFFYASRQWEQSERGETCIQPCYFFLASHSCLCGESRYWRRGAYFEGVDPGYVIVWRMPVEQSRFPFLELDLCWRLQYWFPRSARFKFGGKHNCQWVVHARLGAADFFRANRGICVSFTLHEVHFDRTDFEHIVPRVHVDCP